MPYRYVALAGGGVKVTASIGALSVLDSKGIYARLKGASGASAGAVIAGVIACGAPFDFLKAEIHDLDYRKFRDDNWGFLSDLWNFWFKNGWYKGQAFIDHYREIIRRLTGNPNYTFGDVWRDRQFDLRITVTKVVKIDDYPTCQLVVLNHNDHPDMPIAEAVRMSGGFPWFFQSFPFDGADCVDGGVLMNYPIGVFDIDGTSNPEVIGIRLMGKSQFESRDGGVETRVSNVKEFSFALVNAVFDLAQKEHESPEDWTRSIVIDTDDVSAMDLEISEETKDRLYEKGQAAALKFLS